MFFENGLFKKRGFGKVEKEDNKKRGDYFVKKKETKKTRIWIKIQHKHPQQTLSL